MGIREEGKGRGIVAVDVVKGAGRIGEAGHNIFGGRCYHTIFTHLKDAGLVYENGDLHEQFTTRILGLQGNEVRASYFEPYLIALILMKCLLNTLYPILLSLRHTFLTYTPK